MAGALDILVKLLNESVEVWRPVSVTPVSGSEFRIDEQQYDRDIEQWEFEPGDLVRCQLVQSADGVILAAVGLDAVPAEEEPPHAYSAAIRVFSTSLRVADLVSRLGEPSRSHDIGDLVSPRNPQSGVRKHAHWGLGSTASKTERLDVHLSEILDYLEARSEDFEALRTDVADVEVDIFCGIFWGASQGGFEFDPPLLRRLADAKLKVGFDLY